MLMTQKKRQTQKKLDRLDEILQKWKKMVSGKNGSFVFAICF